MTGTSDVTQVTGPSEVTGGASSSSVTLTTSARVVTIDGPSASGKSTLSRELARHYGWSWVSTGAFYRGLALASRKLNVDPMDEDLLEKLCYERETWSVQMFADRTRVFLHGIDVTDLTSQEDVGMAASQISHFPKVRQALLRAQRNCAQNIPGLIAEGRDCGTVVFPAACAKVFLTANLENRVQRRAKELGLKADDLNVVQQRRDAQDANRKIAPMVTPEGALTLDTTEMDLTAALAALVHFVDSKCA